MRERLEQTELNALDIIERRDGDPSKLTSGNLTTILTWHRLPKVGELNKEENEVGRIMISMKPLPSYEKWANKDQVMLEKAQLDNIKMAHTALGHMVVLKKKELLLTAPVMSQEEFDELVVAKSEATVAMGMKGVIFGTIGEHNGRMNDNASIFEGGCSPMNVSIEALSEGDVEGV